MTSVCHNGLIPCRLCRESVPDTQKPLYMEGRPLGSPNIRGTGRLAKQEDRTHETTLASPRGSC